MKPYQIADLYQYSTHHLQQGSSSTWKYMGAAFFGFRRLQIGQCSRRVTSLDFMGSLGFGYHLYLLGGKLPRKPFFVSFPFTSPLLSLLPHEILEKNQIFEICEETMLELVKGSIAASQIVYLGFVTIFCKRVANAKIRSKNWPNVKIWGFF